MIGIIINISIDERNTIRSAHTKYNKVVLNGENGYYHLHLGLF